MKQILIILLLIFPIFLFSQTPTQIYVRAQAKDAKFIGTSIGGAMVLIKDALTNEILAQGLTKGTTGNTKRIMSTPKNRYDVIAIDGTAKFEAIIDLTEPTFVTIEVHSPISKKQATAVASTQIWLIPGKHILGDGLILEIPGFIVDVLSPQTHQFISGNTQIPIKANVVMMCGCTIKEEGIWDANKIEVKALIKKNGEYLTTIPLKIGKQVNTFEGLFEVSEKGNFEITIYAYDAHTGNTGVDKSTFILE